LAAISAAKKKCIVLALDVTDRDNRYNGISPLVARGFLNDKVGKTYPFAVIASPDQTIRFAELSFKDLSAKANAADAVAAAVEKMESSQSAMPDSATQIAIFLKGGRYSTLYITEVISDTEFKFSMKPNSTGGKVYNIADKSEGVKNYMKRLMELKSEALNAKREEMAKELMPKFELEPWTNTEGKAIKATFVSLTGEDITLAMPRKKNPSTFPLTKLNEASQTRAKELAAKVTEAEEKIKELK